MTTAIHDDKLHRFLLKKIRKEIASGQSVLHLSNKHLEIENDIADKNNYLRVNSLDELKTRGINSKAFSHVIADMDNPELDNFESFLDRVAPLIVRPGLLIIVASNIATFKNQVAIWFGNELENFKRPSRAVTPGYLKNTLLRKGYKVKNRFWHYDEKLLIMGDIPISY